MRPFSKSGEVLFAVILGIFLFWFSRVRQTGFGLNDQVTARASFPAAAICW
jgi:hypothetical protein